MEFRELRIELRLNIYSDRTEWVAFVFGIFKLQDITGIGETPEEAYKNLQDGLEMYYEILERRR